MYILRLTICIAVTLAITLVESVPTPQDARVTTNGISLPSTSSLNSFNKAKELGVHFPPDYKPGRPYTYYIRYSPLILTCLFWYQPEFNNTQVDLLLKRAINHNNDPEKRNEPLSFGLPRDIELREASSDAETYSALWIDVPADAVQKTSDPWPLTKGNLIDTLMGVNRLRLDYRMLDMHCGIWVGTKSAQIRAVQLGNVHLHSAIY
ncbi:MAG: hypothetical protein Q9226_007550 [Calogaya cf. arnoldii]